MKKRVRDSWRKPRGIDNKTRLERKGFAAMPAIGYRQPAAQRHLHPSGLREALVSNEAELEKTGKEFAVRIASGVGGKKRKKLYEKARQLGLKVLN